MGWAEEVVPPNENQSNRSSIFRSFHVKGFYKVVAKGDTVSLLAFNLDKDESLQTSSTVVNEGLLATERMFNFSS